VAYTQSDLTNVQQAIVDLATGKRTTRFVISGEVVEYGIVSLPELRKLRDEIAADVSLADPDSGAASAFVVHGGKGL